MINVQKTEQITRLYIEKLILPSDPLHPLWNRENFLFSKPVKWNYIDGCMIKAVTMLYEITGESSLLDYTVKFMDSYLGSGGTIPTMDPLCYNLDNINGGKNLLYLFKKTGSEKYLSAAEWIYNEQLVKQPRLSCGNFYHKAIYPSQIWLDGTYMALPFMAEYAAVCGNSDIYDDIKRQIKNIVLIMRDAASGLYYHGYDETRSMLWADSETGRSGEFWLRAMCWYSAALADLCELSEAQSPELYTVCSDALKGILGALSDCVSDEDMLYQLPAKCGLEGNYPETSGTLLFSYASLKAYRLGICGEKAKTDGIRTLSAVTENYINITDDNIPVLKNICLVAGLGGAQQRDGSEKYYLSEPIVENDAKGIAPFLMVYTELKRIISQ